MKSSEFDRFADEYHSLHAANIRVSGETPEYFAEYKVRDVGRMLSGANPVARLLDFGAGVGNSTPHLRRAFPGSRIVGLDVSARCLDVARHRFPDMAEFRLFDGERLPLADDEFDLAFAACVFHHIDHALHVAILRDIRRVIAPDGYLALYEHNPWNPLTVRAVRECEFDENAHLIPAREMRRRALAAGFRSAVIGYRIFFPAALRALRGLEPFLGWLPLGAQYCLLCRK